MKNGVDIKPLFARVLLQRDKVSKIGHIYIPPSGEKRHAAWKCQVIAKGPDADEQIRIGSWVIVGEYAGQWINANGKPVAQPDDAEFYICQDEDILVELQNG